MNDFMQISPFSLPINPFTALEKDWALVTAGTPGHCNTMTVSWGGLGILWGRPVATVYIRPQRYTLPFVEEQEFFTLSFFPDGYRKALTLCGTRSGRDCDKIKEAGLTPVAFDGGVSFAEASLVLVCRKRYAGDLKPEGILDPAIDRENYPNKDYHRMFIGEIVKAYTK